jgi:hypothetical protein
MRDHIFSHESDRRLPVSALSSVATVEESKNRLSQDFWYRSIFDFGNSIDTKREYRSGPLFGDERTSLQLVLRSGFSASRALMLDSVKSAKVVGRSSSARDKKFQVYEIYEQVRLSS